MQGAQDVSQSKPAEGEDCVLKVAPTEQVHLENRKLLEDFNFERWD